MSSSTIAKLSVYLNAQIIGQEALVQRLLIALIADGHLLVEGAPGLAKTRAIKVLGHAIEGDFQRIQFTPDLLPADLTGTEIYRPEEGHFIFQRGPLFHNLVLADEVNRAPAKVQSALLEAMAEHQITVAGKTYPLPELFLVMATQNPIEQEGTYSLPEAQLDRFLMQVEVAYPSPEHEKSILRLVRQESRSDFSTSLSASEPAPVEPALEDTAQVETSHSVSGSSQLNPDLIQKPYVCQKDIFAARQAIVELYMAPAVEDYLLQIVLGTRSPQTYSEKLSKWIQYGGSPRASIALDRCARAHAWLKGCDYVSPEDVQEVCADVLRHRLILHYEAEAEGVHSEQAIQELLSCIAVP